MQVLARCGDNSRVYTNLELPWRVGLTDDHKCSLRRVRIPVERVKWYNKRYTVAALWSPAHITLSEADALTWAAEDRLSAWQMMVADLCTLLTLRLVPAA